MPRTKTPHLESHIYGVQKMGAREGMDIERMRVLGYSVHPGAIMQLHNKGKPWRIYLTCTTGGSNKFWEAWWEGVGFTPKSRYGAIGTNGRTSERAALWCARKAQEKATSVRSQYVRPEGSLSSRGAIKWLEDHLDPLGAMRLSTPGSTTPEAPPTETDTTAETKTAPRRKTRRKKSPRPKVKSKPKSLSEIAQARRKSSDW